MELLQEPLTAPRKAVVARSAPSAVIGRQTRSCGRKAISAFIRLAHASLKCHKTIARFASESSHLEFHFRHDCAQRSRQLQLASDSYATYRPSPVWRTCPTLTSVSRISCHVLPRERPRSYGWFRSAAALEPPEAFLLPPPASATLAFEISQLREGTGPRGGKEIPNLSDAKLSRADRKLISVRLCFVLLYESRYHVRWEMAKQYVPFWLQQHSRRR